MPGGSGEFTEVTSTRNRGLGLSLVPGSRCARVREISTRLSGITAYAYGKIDASRRCPLPDAA